MKELTLIIAIVFSVMMMQAQESVKLANILINTDIEYTEKYFLEKGIEYHLHGQNNTKVDITIILNEVAYLYELKHTYSKGINYITIYYQHDNVDHIRELKRIDKRSYDEINPGKYKTYVSIYQ